MNITTCPSAFLVSWCYELKIFQLDLLQSSDNDRNQERVEVSRSVYSQRKAVFFQQMSVDFLFQNLIKRYKIFNKI